MQKKNYSDFDKRTLSLISGGKSNFSQLVAKLETEAKQFCDKPSDEPFRAVDRRLQALRKSGKIGYHTKHGWEIRLADGGHGVKRLLDVKQA